MVTGVFDFRKLFRNKSCKPLFLSLIVFPIYVMFFIIVE
jgi:hypothetical protein